ncbi:hypothetical protein AA0Y32_14965 [Georgenia phoenicis]|uniref:hypothetical protein n=1 Tax=unclassified Georgenia TaxID=2626815 RepID=UPI0039AFF758
MFVSILAGATVLSASILPATATTAATTPPADVILSGSVAGPEVPSNVPVRLFILQPETEATQAQTTGPAVVANRAATVRTDASGRFSLPQSAVDPTALPAQSSRVDVAVIAGEPGGELSVFETTMVYNDVTGDLEIAPELTQPATDSDNTATTDMVPERVLVRPGNPPAGPLTVPDAAAAPAAAAALPAQEVTVDAAGVPHIQMSLVGVADDSQAVATSAGARSLSDASPSATVDGLSSTRVATYKRIPTYVGSIHATTNGYTAKFSTTTSANGSFGTAINMGRGWNAGGTVSRSMGITTSWGPRNTAGNWVLGTYYSTAKYKNTLCEYGACSTYHTIRAYMHEGGATSGAASAPTATYCRPYEKGAGVRLNKNAATTWNAGLKISSIVGFNVTSRAGYSNNEVLNITATAKRNFCGTNTYPGNFPARIVVKP